MGGINFNKMPGKYWEEHVKISYLQRLIIVYSIMYYEMNESCISDKRYDEISSQLVHLQNSVDIEEFKKTQYYYVMYDFDGTTGFDIPGRLTDKDRKYLAGLAEVILRTKRMESSNIWNKDSG